MRNSILTSGYWLRTVILILILTLNLTGCAQLRKKFIRKKKVTEPLPHYERIMEYDASPSIELYTKHYVYWRSWHRDAVVLLGKNIKKDKRCIREMISNLEDMKSMLDDEEGGKLEKHIAVLRKLESDIKKGSLTHATKTRMRRVLEREFTLIKRNFSYAKMDSHIRSDFRRTSS